MRAYFNVLIRNLELLDRSFTRQDKVGLLRKPPCHGEHLIELIGRIDRIQYRPIGWYGPQPREVTLVIGAIERGGAFEPRNACRMAIERKGLVQSDRRFFCDHDFS